MSANIGRLVSLVAGAVAGVVMTALAPAQIAEGHGRLAGALVAYPMSAAGGAIAGALCGFLLWVLASPRRRLQGIAILLAALNCGAWLLFLMANPRAGDGGTSILEQRVALDAGGGSGVMFVDHPPTLLAGRELNWVDLSQKPLGIFAGPAVVFVHEQIVPARYWQTGATDAESNWIGLMAFGVSTAWWVATGSLVSALRRWRKRRHEAGDPSNVSGTLGSILL